jgi:hypothetical protein
MHILSPHIHISHFWSVGHTSPQVTLSFTYYICIVLLKIAKYTFKMHLLYTLCIVWDAFTICMVWLEIALQWDFGIAMGPSRRISGVSPLGAGSQPPNSTDASQQTCGPVNHHPQVCPHPPVLSMEGQKVSTKCQGTIYDTRMCY